MFSILELDLTLRKIKRAKKRVLMRLKISKHCFRNANDRKNGKQENDFNV